MIRKIKKAKPKFIATGLSIKNQTQGKFCRDMVYKTSL